MYINVNIHLKPFLHNVSTNIKIGCFILNQGDTRKRRLVKVNVCFAESLNNKKVWIYQRNKQREGLCLSCDCIRSTLSMMFGWLYFYEKWKTHTRSKIMCFSSYISLGYVFCVIFVIHWKNQVRHKHLNSGIIINQG